MSDLSFIIMFIIFILSFVILYIIMPYYIELLKREGLNQEVSEYALKEYKEKAKTPIMGGLLFVLIPVFVLFIIRPHIFTDKSLLMVITSYSSFCLIGFIDDILILYRHDNNGLSPKFKLALQLIFALIISFIFKGNYSTQIHLPFTDLSIDLGNLYPLFLIFVYAAEANAVNFTDGMDGLCAGVSFISLIPFLLFAIIGKKIDLAFLICAILGSLLAYLHYNRFPAKIFMGDSGSLALGALFASLGIVLNKEIALVATGGIFVLEMFCVVLQLTWVKLFHSRIFSYTPIHYAFRLKGLSEQKIVKDFYILAGICAIIGAIIGIFG